MKKINALLCSIGLGAFLFSGNTLAADNSNDKSANADRILFKIHDVAPEKDANGNINSCNISVTLFNNYDKALSNTQITLKWDDEVISDIISQEEYETKEAINRNPDATRSRYPTAKTTAPTITTTIKIPLINAHQQISLKNKVDTDRCFLLMNDMEIQANSCTFAGEATSDRGCRASFSYVSPNSPQYFSEFKEISYDEEVNNKEQEIDADKAEAESIYDEIVNTLRKIGK